jgi:hypothetical protein
VLLASAYQLQCRSVASNLPRDDSAHEENLLIEAVSLLVEHQRETEARVAAIEDRVNRLVREQASARPAGADERLARLREQVAGLRSGEIDSRPVRTVAPVRSVVPAPAPTSVRDVIGASGRQRFGSLMMLLGALAVLYAVGSQLHIG